jgi:hypothetical protein
MEESKFVQGEHQVHVFERARYLGVGLPPLGAFTFNLGADFALGLEGQFLLIPECGTANNSGSNVSFEFVSQSVSKSVSQSINQSGSQPLSHESTYNEQPAQ